LGWAALAGWIGTWFVEGIYKRRVKKTAQG
jgi:hypothetical protein